MGAIVEVSHLSKSFGEINAVNDLSFTVEEGDVYGFLGQNGAGKSTSMRMMLTLIAPSSGSIKIFGKELQHNRNEILRQTGAIIEKPDLYKYLSAYDNLELFARLSGIKPTRLLLMEQLDKVGIAQRAKSKIKTFSQGMKQRLGIAIALIHNPRLVILDEPTNGLDPQGIAEMRNIIISLSREHGKTVIVSSHLLNEIEQVASRILIIDKGKKIIEGSASEMFDPAKTLVSLQAAGGDVLSKLEGTMFGNCYQKSIGDEMIFEMHRKDIPAFNAMLVEKGVPVLSISPRHSLEDYFLRLTA
ncbi:MAG: ABC transporter ATP-binding protein [Chitinophagaceae bacterium]